jgi:hypothetical protein
MSEQVKSDSDVGAANRSTPASSLKGRMEARAAELANRKTEVFPIPRYDSVIAVELKAISWEKTQEIIERHSRVGTRQTLNASADEIVFSTVAFHELKPDGSLELVEDVHSWSEVTQALLGISPPEGPYNTRERVCMLSLVSDQGVMALSAQFRQWLGGVSSGISEAVRQDFSTTP